MLFLRIDWFFFIMTYRERPQVEFQLANTRFQDALLNFENFSNHTLKTFLVLVMFHKKKYGLLHKSLKIKLY